jgi:hypothetical protein
MQAFMDKQDVVTLNVSRSEVRRDKQFVTCFTVDYHVHRFVVCAVHLYVL